MGGQWLSLDSPKGQDLGACCLFGRESQEALWESGEVTGRREKPIESVSRLSLGQLGRKAMGTAERLWGGPSELSH